MSAILTADMIARAVIAVSRHARLDPVRVFTDRSNKDDGHVRQRLRRAVAFAVERHLKDRHGVDMPAERVAQIMDLYRHRNSAATALNLAAARGECDSPAVRSVLDALHWNDSWRGGAVAWPPKAITPSFDVPRPPSMPDVAATKPAALPPREVNVTVQVVPPEKRLPPAEALARALAARKAADREIHRPADGEKDLGPVGLAAKRTLGFGGRITALKRDRTGERTTPRDVIDPADEALIEDFLKKRGVTELPPGQAAGTSAIEQQLYTAPPPRPEGSWVDKRRAQSRKRVRP